MAISGTAVINNSIVFIRDLLRSNVTDPISATRETNSGFVMTSYPDRKVNYPLITVKLLGFDAESLGMNNEQYWCTMRIEVRIWAKNQKQRDNLTDEVFNVLRQNKFGTGSTVTEQLYGFSLLSTSDVEESKGNASILSRLMVYEYSAVAAD